MSQIGHDLKYYTYVEELYSLIKMARKPASILHTPEEFEHGAFFLWLSLPSTNLSLLRTKTEQGPRSTLNTEGLLTVKAKNEKYGINICLLYIFHSVERRTFQISLVKFSIPAHVLAVLFSQTARVHSTFYFTWKLGSI